MNKQDQNCVKPYLVSFLFALAMVSILSSNALASESNGYPYDGWAVCNEYSSIEDTISCNGTSWKTLYGTVTAPEMTFGELRYWVYLPTDYEPDREYPLVVYLHGSSVSYNQSKYSPWLHTLNQRSCNVADGLREVLGDCIIFTPQVPSTKEGTVAGSAWTNSAGSTWKKSTEETTGSSNYLKATEKLMAGYIDSGVTYQDSIYAVNGNRVYLIGDSMGGFGAYAMLQDCPTTFAAVMVRAGTGNPYTVEAWKDTPIRIFHGTADTNVPYESSTRMIEALDAVGAKDAQRVTIQYGGHDIRTDMYRTLDEQGNNVYLTWLSQQNKADYIINCKEDYYQLRDAVNEGNVDALTYVGKKTGGTVNRADCAAMNISLGEDIILTEAISGVGTAEYPFTGVFDGNHHTVTFDNVACAGETAVNVSLLGCVVDGVVRNVNLTGAVSYVDTALKFVSEDPLEETACYVGPLCSQISGSGSVCDVSSSVDITYSNQDAKERIVGEVLVTDLLGRCTVPAVNCVATGSINIVNTAVEKPESVGAIVLSITNHPLLTIGLTLALVFIATGIYFCEQKFRFMKK